MTKKEMSFKDKSIFTIGILLTVYLFIITWSLITLGIYLAINGGTVSNVSLIVTVFALPPIFTYLKHRYFLIYFFKRRYISKLTLLKLKNLFGNLSLVLVAVLSTVKIHIPTKMLEKYAEHPNFLKDPIGYIEHDLILFLQPVNLTYLTPTAFAIIAFLFSFLETSNFATYKIYIEEEKINYSTYPNETTKDNISYLQDITLEIESNFNQMQSEIKNFEKC